MPRDYEIDWKGPQVRMAVFDATKDAINEIMGDCVVEAQRNTPVVTGNARRSIKIQELARQDGNTVAGLWGSADVAYFLSLEVGTQGGPVNVTAHSRRAPSGTIHNVRAHVRQTAPRPGRYMLRSASDSHYPRLAGRIRENLQGRLAT